MRATGLIAERMKVICAREHETEEILIDDWMAVLREMAEAGFNVAELLCDVQTYKADARRGKNEHI